MQHQLDDMKSRMESLEKMYYDDVRIIHSKLDEAISGNNEKKIVDEARITKLETHSGFIIKLLFLGLIGLITDFYEVIKAKIGS